MFGVPGVQPTDLSPIIDPLYKHWIIQLPRGRQVPDPQINGRLVGSRSYAQIHRICMIKCKEGAKWDPCFEDPALGGPEAIE